MENTNWSSLSRRILKKIAYRLTSLGDRLRFAAVCRSWGASILQNGRLRTYDPSLILFDQEQEGRSGSCYRRAGGILHFFLFDVDHRKAQIGIRVPPEFVGLSPFGACHSWLGMMDQSNASACLLDPFTGEIVPLPPVVDVPLCVGPSSIEPWFPLKLCLSSPDPGADPCCVAVVIRSRTRRLAYAVPGRGGDWVMLDHPDVKGYDDVVFDDGFFYAISADGVVVAIQVITGGDRGSGGGCHVDPRICNVSILIRSVFSRVDGRLFLAVHPDGDLVVVSIKDDHGHPLTLSQVTGVSKIDMVFVREEVIQSLGDCALFLGCSCSLSIQAPQIEGVPLCVSVIYFANDCWVPRNAFPTFLVQHFIWVNNFERRLRVISGHTKPSSFLIPPMWISPRLRQASKEIPLRKERRKRRRSPTPPNLRSEGSCT